MAVRALDVVSSSPVAYAQYVVEENQAKSVEGAQAKLAKQQVEAEAQVEKTLIESASLDGRSLLARA